MPSAILLQTLLQASPLFACCLQQSRSVQSRKKVCWFEQLVVVSLIAELCC